MDQRSREIPGAVERKHYNQRPENSTSMLLHMEAHILQGVAEPPDTEEDNRHFLHGSMELLVQVIDLSSNPKFLFSEVKSEHLRRHLEEQ